MIPERPRNSKRSATSSGGDGHPDRYPRAPRRVRDEHHALANDLEDGRKLGDPPPLGTDARYGGPGCPRCSHRLLPLAEPETRPAGQTASASPGEGAALE